MEKDYTEIDDGIKEYFKSLKHFKSLSKEEEHNLLKAYKNHNDLNARNKLIEANLKYACKLANTYRGKGLPFSDLIEEANDGLIDAIDRFDINQDVKLISYSKWYIIQRLEKITDSKKKINTEDIQDFNLNDDSPSNRNFIYDEDEENRYDVDGLLETLVEDLSPREKDMILKYHGIGCKRKYTLEDLGDEYHLTRERVRQIIEKSITKVRSKAMVVDSIFMQ